VSLREKLKEVTGPRQPTEYPCEKAWSNESTKRESHVS